MSALQAVEGLLQTVPIITSIRHGMDRWLMTDALGCC